MAPKKQVKSTAKGRVGKVKKQTKAQSKVSLERHDQRAHSLAAQALRESIHFKGFSYLQKHGQEIDGKTLFMVLKEAKLSEIQGKPHPCFGASWYRILAAQYRGDSWGGAEICSARSRTASS